MNTLWKRTALLLSAALCLTLFSGGCSDSDDSQNPDLRQIKIGMTVYRQDDTFISTLSGYFLETAKARESRDKVKISVNVMDGKGNQGIQNDQVDKFLSQGYDFICVNEVDRTAASVIIDKAKSANIPIVFFNREPVEEDMQRWDRAYYVGAIASESGVLQGRIVSNLFNQNPELVDRNGDGKIQYVMLEGEPGHQDAAIRTEYSIKTVTGAGISVEKLANDTANWPQGPAVWAESAVVMDLDSGTFLYSKNMDVAKYPASITKILTTLIAIEHSRLSEKVTFSENAVYGIEQGSSNIGIRLGENLTMEDCLYGMMLESANEVCVAVAEHISGSVDAFVELMNQKAASLGCTNTHFTNPNGLPDENHYTTAHDMALIAQAAYNNATFRKVCQTTTYCIGKTNKCGEERWLSNHHKMLPDRDYTYEGCTGGKTGFTSLAGNTLVTFARRNGMTLVSACMCIASNQRKTDLYRYGFAVRLWIQ